MDALLVIDMQVSLLEDETPNPDEIVPAVTTAVEKARGAGVPVVWITDSRVGPNGGLIEGFVPAPGEAQVLKGECDSFDGTDLGALLTGQGAKSLGICGMQSDACVEATVRSAAGKGYRVTLLGDAHTTHDYDGRDYRAEITAQNAALGALEGVTVMTISEAF